MTTQSILAGQVIKSSDLNFYSLPIRVFSKPDIGLLEVEIQGDKRGRIRYGGTIWFAQPFILGLDIYFPVGQLVVIYARQGNTMLILPSTEQLLDA